VSNPLLKPEDPRFRKPEIRDTTGKNRFAEGESQVGEGHADDVYAAGPSDEPRPFVPRYEAQQRPQYPLLMLLGGLGWLAAAIGAVSLTGLFAIGWICPLIGIAPAAAGWLLAHEDMKAIRVGAIAAEATPPTRHAFWLGLGGLIACLGVVAAMIYRQMNFLPNLF
jgi:hypothetical protein